MTMRRIGTYLYDELEERHMVDPGISITGSLSGPLGVGDDAITPLLAAAQAEINRVFTVPARFLRTILPLPPSAFQDWQMKVIMGIQTQEGRRFGLLRKHSRGWRRHVRRQKAMRCRTTR